MAKPATINFALSPNRTRDFNVEPAAQCFLGGLAVRDQELLSLAMELRARAEEMSGRAETFHDADIRQKLRGIAAGYEKLARRLEQHAGDVDKV